MKAVRALAFRYLTDADFFNLYKPRGSEERGGGQKYIDFPTTTITVDNWRSFFQDVTGVVVSGVAQGPRWEFPIHSIGVATVANLSMYQRRPQSVCISSQHINTRNANRAPAWLPANGFPEPAHPDNRQQLPPGLVIYLVRTWDAEVWAGWFQQGHGPGPARGVDAGRLIQLMTSPLNEEGDAGMLSFARDTLLLDTIDRVSPFATPVVVAVAPVAPPVEPEAPAPTFATPAPGPPGPAAPPRQPSEEEIIESLFGEDIADQPLDPEAETTLVRVRRRNRRAVRSLKELYGHRCQISGEQFTFTKRDGIPYTEAHHLVPLGRGGADDPRNLIVVSAHIHRMLHYATVTGLELANIVVLPDGTSTLEIQINGSTHTIMWHREHARRVLEERDAT